MNKRQLIIQKQFVKDEKAVLKELKDEYSKALQEIEEKVLVLQGRNQTVSVQNQLQKQLQLRQQISTILDKMRSNNYDQISKYLNECYEDGFLGTLFDLQGQGVPLAFPINQQQVIKAITLDSKISKGLYKRLGYNVEDLKKKISSEITRGIIAGKPYQEIAKQLQLITDVDYKKSKRIAVTEGHRIQNQSTLDAMYKAKAVGADIKKQWDSTLDGRTRSTHRELDGQIVDVDEEFVIPSTGSTAKCAGGFGIPSEDCNCRCAILQRASWNLNNYDATKMDNESGQLISFKEKDYSSFKNAYFKTFGGM